MSPRRARAVAGRLGEDPATALRHHLLDTAEWLLGERQVSAITTRDIALTAGVSEGVLYNYFSDKHDLLLAAMLRRYDGLAAQFEAGLPQPGSATVDENLHTLARAALELQSGVLPLMTGLITEPALLRRFVEEMHQRPLGPEHTMRRVGDYIGAEQRLGRLAADVDPAPYNTLLMGATSLLAFTRMLSPTSPSEEVASELGSVVRALVRGLAS